MERLGEEAKERGEGVSRSSGSNSKVNNKTEKQGKGENVRMGIRNFCQET